MSQPTNKANFLKLVSNKQSNTAQKNKERIENREELRRLRAIILKDLED